MNSYAELKPCKGWAGLFTMLMYYEDDKSSQDTIRRFRPSELLVVPDIYIRLNKDNPANLTIARVYPNLQEARFVAASNRAVDCLRKLFKSKGGVWECYKEGRLIVFHKNCKVLHRGRQFQPLQLTQ